MTVFVVLKNIQNYNDFSFWIERKLIGIYQTSELAEQAIKEFCEEEANSYINHSKLDTSDEDEYLSKAEDARNNREYFLFDDGSEDREKYKYQKLFEIREIPLNQVCENNWK